MGPLRERTLGLWRRAPPAGRRVTVVAATLLVAWLAALTVANRPAARARLRASIRTALERRLPGVELGDSLVVDPLFRVSFGPLAIPAERKGAPPVLRAERVRVRASPSSLLGGRVEPASLRFYDVRIVPGERWAGLRELAARTRSRPDPAAGAQRPEQPGTRGWPAIHLRNVTVFLHGDGRDEPVGPLDVSLVRRRSEADDDVQVAISLRRGGRAWVQLHRDAAGFNLRASALELRPDVLPAALAAPVRWSAGSLAGELTFAGGWNAPASGRVRIRIDRAWLTGERLAPAPVGPVSAELEGALQADLASRTVALREANLRLLGTVDARLMAEASLAPGFPFSVTLGVPALDFDALVGALPAPLRPPAEAPTPAGPLAFHLSVAGPLREPSTWSVDANLDLARLREAARRAPPVALRAPFTWRPEPAAGSAPPILVGPGNPAFVPIADLPTHVIRAVTTSEDAGFFAHPGFDFEELRNAFAQGTEAGRVVRGASTITQQLAKNLYLSRERTLARKAREALIAIGLEATVPKTRLLEIYLNIAEWGPGLRGIGPAAQHYFGKPARELTVREAAFLASIIPNPVRYHGYFARGELDEAWTERLRVILLHMAEAHAIDEDQLVAALDEPLRFASRTAALEPAGEDGAPSPWPAPSPAEEGGPR